MCAFCPPVDLLTKTTVLSKHNEQKNVDVGCFNSQCD